MSDSADKRSVHTDALATLGQILDDAQRRDAIHLAVEPVIAAHRLRPGDHITVEDGFARLVPVGEGLGIVDPFLARTVEEGQRFWFVMYPRQVRSLRHVWTHPAFPDEPRRKDGQVLIYMHDQGRSGAWLLDYADKIGVDHKDLIRAANDWLDDDEPLCRGSSFEGLSTDPDFWRHFQAFTGRVPAPEKQTNFFSCSC